MNSYELKKDLKQVVDEANDLDFSDTHEKAMQKLKQKEAISRLALSLYYDYIIEGLEDCKSRLDVGLKADWEVDNFYTELGHYLARIDVLLDAYLLKKTLFVNIEENKERQGHYYALMFQVGRLNHDINDCFNKTYFLEYIDLILDALRTKQFLKPARS